MPAKPNEIQLIRVYDAPVELVWEAWTDLKHIEKWWGPRGFTLTTKSKDLRPGGQWIYTMHGPDGTNYPNIATYHEVVKYAKLVYDHGGNEERDKLFTVTVLFKEENGKTTINMTSVLRTPEEAQAMRQFIKNANGNSTWDRLGEYLENETSGKDVFLINRTFAADVKTVFDMWVDPAHFAKWLGPVNGSIAFVDADVGAGGESKWALTLADGPTHYGKFNYQRIDANRLLVYTQSFIDPRGNVIRSPFSPTYPMRLLTTVSFMAEGPSETRVTIKWEVFGEATEAERQTFHDMKAIMTGGWNGSFDKLDALLETQS